MISSIIAAWSDISNALDGTWTSQDPAAVIGGLHTIQQTIERLNVGYVWMFCNCFTSAAFVSSYRARFLFFGDGVMLSGLFLDCRCYRCENESKWLDSQTGIRCFIIIYFRYRYCSCFRYWWRIGVRRTWSRICAYLDLFLKMGGELRTLTPRRL